MGSRRFSGSSTKKDLPGYARTVILLQALVIAFLSLWVYEEYQNNQYFQAYLNNLFRVNGEAYVLLPTFILTILSVVAYAKIRASNGKADRIGHAGTDRGIGEGVPDIITNPSPNAFPPAPIAAPALANAATRVLKRIALGESSSEIPRSGKPMPMLEKVEPRNTLQKRESTPTPLSTTKKPEPVQRSMNLFPVETNQVPRLGMEPRSRQTGGRPPWQAPFVPGPRESKHSSTESASRGLFNPFRETGIGTAPIERLSPANTDRPTPGGERRGDPRDRATPQRFSPFTHLSPSRQSQEHGQIPHLALPAPGKPVTLGRGPLDNPLPENPLVPVLKHVQPSQSQEHGPSPRPPLHELRRQGSEQPPAFRPIPQNPVIGPGLGERPSIVGGSIYHPKTSASGHREAGPGFQFAEQGEKTDVTRPIDPKIRDADKSPARAPPPPGFGAGPSLEGANFSQKRPLIPGGIGQHQSILEKVPAKKLENVLKHLQPGAAPTDKPPNQNASTLPQGLETVPRIRIVEKALIVSRQDEIRERQTGKRPDRAGRSGLNRVEPLPGAADNAWAKKLPRGHVDDESATGSNDEKPLKRQPVRKPVDKGPGKEEPA